jgi:type IV pilus assembly protein PilW
MGIQSKIRHVKFQTGFSLLEIMVGVVIGILGIVVIFQVMSVFEGRKRTTGTGSDAQVAGNIALFNLERDLKMAGNGFGTSSVVGCTVNAYDTNRLPASIFSFKLIPVEIIENTTGGPDTINVLHGDSNMVVNTLPFNDSPTTLTKKLQISRAGLQTGEIIIVGQNTTSCAMAEITDNSDPDNLTIAHQANSPYTNYLNQQVVSRLNDPVGITIPQGSINDLGLNPQRSIWTVGDGSAGAQAGKLVFQNDLKFVDVNPKDNINDWLAVADGIVNLKARYGVDVGCGSGNAGVQCTGAITWTNTPPAKWLQVAAVQVAILARSQQYEKPNPTSVTTTPPEWAAGAFTMFNVDGTKDTFGPGDPDPNNWRNYRYRVYQTIVPLRNVIWGGGIE